MTSKLVQVIVDPSRVRPAEAPALWGDTAKAERAVEWKRQYDLKTTLRDLVNFWEIQFHSGAIAIPEGTSSQS